MFFMTKRQFFHRRILFAAMMFLVVCFAAFFFQWIYTPMITNYGGPDFNTSHGTAAVFRWHQICAAFQLDKWMITLVNLPFPLLPLMPVILSYNFIKEKAGYYLHAYTRVGDYRRFMWKSIGLHALLSGVYYYVTYLLFLGIGMILSKTVFYDNTYYGMMDRKETYSAWTIYPNYYTKSFLADLMGKYFFNQHPIEFYLLFGFVATFIFGIIYSLFAISVSFLSDKNYLSILIPYGYFVFGSVFFGLLLNKMLYFAPISTFGGLSYSSQPTFYTILPMIFPLIFALIVIIVKINRGDRLGV